MADWQGIAAVIAAIGGLIAAVVGGVYTGKNARRKDQQDYEQRLEEARASREIAEELASQKRVEELVKDMLTARDQVRRADEQLQDVRKERNKWEDRARYHFGLLTMISHIIRNIFTVESAGGNPETVAAIVRSQRLRMASVVIPIDVEGNPPPIMADPAPPPGQAA